MHQSDLCVTMVYKITVKSVGFLMYELGRTEFQVFSGRRMMLSFHDFPCIHLGIFVSVVFNSFYSYFLISH